MSHLLFLCLTMVDMNAANLPAILGSLVPVVGAVMLFGVFLPIATWTGHRHKEREAFYKSETLRRITEASPEGAKAAIELLREDDRLARIKQREGVKIGGLVTLGVGISLSIFLFAIPNARENGAYLVGLIPGLIGVALLVYAYWLAVPVE